MALLINLTTPSLSLTRLVSSFFLSYRNDATRILIEDRKQTIFSSKRIKVLGQIYQQKPNINHLLLPTKRGKEKRGAKLLDIGIYLGKDDEDRIFSFFSFLFARLSRSLFRSLFLLLLFLLCECIKAPHSRRRRKRESEKRENSGEQSFVEHLW